MNAKELITGKFRLGDVIADGKNFITKAKEFILKLNEKICAQTERRELADEEDVQDIYTLNEFPQRPAERNTQFTPQERKTISKITHIFPRANQVEMLMLAFVSDLKKRHKEMALGAPELAAFAHKKIIQIHPFDDGNGRLARIVMNAILLKGGYPPVVFTTKEKYKEVVIESTSFLNYLMECIETQRPVYERLCAESSNLHP